MGNISHEIQFLLHILTLQRVSFGMTCKSALWRDREFIDLLIPESCSILLRKSLQLCILYRSLRSVRVIEYALQASSRCDFTEIRCHLNPMRQDIWCDKARFLVDRIYSSLLMMVFFRSMRSTQSALLCHESVVE